jgi:hypothetical protein
MIILSLIYDKPLVKLIHYNISRILYFVYCEMKSHEFAIVRTKTKKFNSNLFLPHIHINQYFQ